MSAFHRKRRSWKMEGAMRSRSQSMRYVEKLRRKFSSRPASISCY
jgi:hypothetical protein